ncbi:MAG: OmpA family protein [Bacteroidia bacterium]
MKTNYLTLFLLLFFSLPLASQVKSDKTAIASRLVEEEKYSEALPSLLALLKGDSLDPALNFKCGLCYLNSRSQQSKALPYLQKAEKNADGETGKVPLEIYKYLGDAWFHLLRFDMALQYYQKFNTISELPLNKPLQAEMKWKTEMCRKGIEIKENISCPLLVPDGNQKYFESAVLKGPDQASVKKIPVDTNARNEATVGTSVDGQTVLLYADDKGNGNLFTIRLVGNQWTRAQRLNKPLNKSGWENNESISADGRNMYFTSDREGGYGGRDIYKCVRLSDGSWSKAVNLGPVINSAFDDEAPFIHPNGKILYFSSNALSSNGAFDIYTSVVNASGEWSKPLNVGYPATITEGKTYEQITSEPWRQAKLNPYETLKEKENFMVTFFDPEKQYPLTMLKGKVLDSFGKVPEETTITVTDNETGEICASYHSDSGSGEYLFILPAGRNNNITYETAGCLFQSKNMNVFKEGNYYELHAPVQMPPVSEGSAVTLNNVFFEKDKATLLSASNIELSKLVDILEEDPGMVIELSNYLFTDENEKTSRALAQSRAMEVVKYLADKGISKDRMVAKAYCKAKPAKEQLKYDNIIEFKILEWSNHKIK